MWLGHDLSYEPLIGLIVSLASFAWDDSKVLLNQRKQESYEHDKKIYEEIVKIFEEKDIIYFLRQVNFETSFLSQRGLDIFFVSENYEPPIYEIWNKKLEDLRNTLFNSLDQLAHTIAMSTYSIKNDRHIAIPDLYRGSFEPLPDHVQVPIDKLHKLASEVIDKYSVFYREGGKLFDNRV